MSQHEPVAQASGVAQLETTDASIDQIADGVGFGSAATLRLPFARSLGTTPTAYRRRFAVPGRRRGV